MRENRQGPQARSAERKDEAPVEHKYLWKILGMAMFVG
jgi:hypothetical protein